MLKVGEGLPQGEAIHDRFIGRICIFEKIRRFTGREVVLDGVEPIDLRRITGEPKRESSRQRIVEETHASAEYSIVGYTEWLPSEAEAWRPENAVRSYKSLSLIGDNGSLVWLIRIMTDEFKRTRKTGETAILAYRI